MAEAPTQPAAPVAPTPPSDFSPRTGINIHEAATKPPAITANPEPAPQRPAPITAAQVAATTKAAEAPEKASEKTASESSKWTVDSLLESFSKDLKEDDPKLKQWGHHKEFTKNLKEANESQAMRILDLERQLETKLAAPVSSGDPTEIEKALRAEMLALRDSHNKELQEYTNWKAKQDLENNEAFRREYDGKRVALLEEARSTAAEIGLDPAKLDAVFEAKSELQVRKAVKALELDDEDAEALIMSKALESTVLGNKKQMALSGKNGKTLAETAAEWQAHMAEFGKSFSTQMTSQLQGMLMKATESAAERLKGTSSFFGTPQGLTVFQELQNRFRQGYDLDAAEVVDALALARVAPVFERQAIALAQERDALKAQNAALTKNTPGALMNGSSTAKGAPAPSSLPSFNPFQTRTGIDIHSKK